MNVTNVTNSSLIQNTSMEDRKLTEEACEFIAAIGAGLFYGAIFILMILCTRYNYCPKPEACKVLFLVGTAVMLLHIFTNDKYEDIDDLKVKLGFGISANLTIGITTLLMALWIFKKRPSLNCTENCPIPCINPHHKDDKLCCFGAVGLAYWFYAAVLVTSWAISKNGFNDYFNWSSAKYYYRCLTAFHLIYTFMKTTMENMTTISFCRSKCNHFLTGCLVLGMFSEFLGAALDQYVGPIEERYQYVLKSYIISPFFSVRVFLMFRAVVLRTSNARHPPS
ncbi:hypothetical protein AC249_AIPGENE28888 [Exaiptasia diaphana]|nr:hypothetical protein AC249_AIPGENE28888 [Exaiptasia diaphana]